MSMSFALNVPTDIPWRRICVSQDMLDPLACDKRLPARWRSSIAVYRYDPADEYQPYEDLRVAYLKVAVTITPWAPEIGVDLASKYVPPQLVDSLQEAFPCYGALLHVTVAPEASGEVRGFNNYPYIADCEPKKRELYEMVTDTGEVLSGSSSTLAVGKGGVSTNTTENYNIDTGWNFGMQGSYAGTGGGVSVGESGQWGSVNRAGMENTNIRTSETSSERRELQSHVTQLSQMYNLFQAFHIGTNRAVFFLEPRPHIRQSEATFINGPRALEGLQEIFITVVYHPERDFCVGTVLETAHLTKEPVYAYDEDSYLFTDFRLTATAENRDDNWDKNDFTSQPVTLTRDYMAPAGWEIVGYETEVIRAQRVSSGPTVTFTPSQLSVSGAVTWRFWEGSWSVFGGYEDHYENGILDVNVTVKLRKKEGRLTDYIRKLFLSARQLCCCAESVPIKPSIVFETELKGVGAIAVKGGRATESSLAESRRLASEIKHQMILSTGSHRRSEMGTVAYEESDAFLTRVADVLKGARVTREMGRPIAQSSVVDEDTRARLVEVLGDHVALTDVLSADADKLGRSFGTDAAGARKFKAELLSRIADRLPRRGKGHGFGGGKPGPKAK